MKELNQAIINIQTNLEISAKKNKHMEKWIQNKKTNEWEDKGYDYFNETGIYNVLKPLMKQEGIGYTIEAIGQPIFTKEGNMTTYISQGQIKLFKGEAEKVLGITLAATNTDPAKAVGSALTYGAKYWLCKIFGIATDELDPDTTENTKAIQQDTINIYNSQETIKAPETINTDDIKKQIINEILNKVKNDENYKKEVQGILTNKGLTSFNGLTIEELKELI